MVLLVSLILLRKEIVLSNYTIETNNPKLEAFVGWDPMMNTFFAHVTDLTKEEDDPEYDVLWIGTRIGEVRDLDIVVQVLRKIGVIVSNELYRKIYADANT
jgi:hypothetical protein